MKIDIFAHFLPKKYCKALGKKAEGEAQWFTTNQVLSQIDVRLRVMDMYPDVMQVLTVATPPLETMVAPKEAIELARLANDEMAEIVNKYPNKFLTAVACLPLNDIESASSADGQP